MAATVMAATEVAIGTVTTVARWGGVDVATVIVAVPLATLVGYLMLPDAKDGA